MALPPQWFLTRLISPILRPLTRLLVGLFAIPLLRLVRRKVVRTQEWNEEFERDVEQWFRASALLLFATKNVELYLGNLLNFHFDEEFNWYIAAGRIMLAIGVIETMPDQQLFPILYPGPPPFTWDRTKGMWANIRPQILPFLKGSLNQHLSRSSPVLAIMATIFEGWIGWTCFGICIAQYLFIGLITSRSKALDLLSEFDREVAKRREQLLDEFYPTKTIPNSIEKDAETTAVDL